MHGRRSAYYIAGEGVFREPEFMSGGHSCPASGSTTPPAPSFRFGRMFPRPERRMTSREWLELSEGLIKLGLCMNDPATYCKCPPAEPPGDSNIPAGYTYLGQFIAHEITFDNTQDLPAVAPDPKNLRSPSLDLDSLYGNGPRDEQSRPLYEDGPKPARLKLSRTLGLGFLKGRENDLPRDGETQKALVADPRNDENLAIAQTHVAFIKFHNKVVDTLKAQGHGEADLFDCARIQAVRHFQWIVLHDYLPRLVDEKVIDCAVNHGRRWFRVRGAEDLYMPLEFSAAAFRFGHSMVRGEYQWNLYHARGDLGRPSGAFLPELFGQTAFSGGIGTRERPGQPTRSPGLTTEWIIDWRRFYEFTQPAYRVERSRFNMARGIDTHFDFRLEEMDGFPHGSLPPEKKSITVRNLLRGFALGLPTGEEVAAYIGEEPLAHDKVAGGPHGEVLSAPAFRGRTPLWYYVLKEAELNGGNQLGPVGGRIVAETLVGLIKHSRYSILDAPDWLPSYTERRDPKTGRPLFEMTDLLHFAGVVNPLGGQ